MRRQASSAQKGYCRETGDGKGAWWDGGVDLRVEGLVPTGGEGKRSAHGLLQPRCEEARVWLELWLELPDKEINSPCPKSHCQE